MVWIVPLLLQTERILLWVGEPARVARLSGEYTRAALLGYWQVFAFECLAAYLRNVSRPMPAVIATGVCTGLHVCWCYIFVLRLGLGNAGAGYANALTWTLQLVGLV